MKTLIPLAVLILLAGLAVADPIVVNFDDLEGFGAIEAGYGGIMSWGGPPGTAPVWAHNDEDEGYPALSPPQMAFPVGGPPPIEFGQNVMLIGFSCAEGQAGPPIPFHFKLLLENEVVFEIPMFYPSDHPVFWECPYDGIIDTMILDQIDGQPYGFFALDNLTYDVASVPTDKTTWGSLKSLYQ